MWGGAGGRGVDRGIGKACDFSPRVDTPPIDDWECGGGSGPSSEALDTPAMHGSVHEATFEVAVVGGLRAAVN